MKPSKKFPLSLAFINFLVFLSAMALGQGEEKFKNVFVEAESYFLFEEYKDALPLYQKSTKIITSIIRLEFY